MIGIYLSSFKASRNAATALDAQSPLPSGNPPNSSIRSSGVSDLSRCTLLPAASWQSMLALAIAEGHPFVS
jgi:hypothetical protein